MSGLGLLPTEKKLTFMKIQSSKFATSAGKLSQIPRDGLLQIAFAGRSNVGKSSLLNSLLNRRKLALVSKTPGKTRTINFYLINGKFYFVDLPGYGYAKVAKSAKGAWRPLIEQYLRDNPRLACLVCLIDLRHGLTALDFELLEWVTAFAIPVVVVGTKADKLSGNERAAQLRACKKQLQPFGISLLIPFSATIGTGKAELWKCIDEYLRNRS